MFLKRNKKLTQTLVMLLLSTPAYATNTYEKGNECKPLIEACDKALSTQKEQLKLANDALKFSMDESKALEEQVKAKESQLSNPIRQPVVLVGIGVIGTVLAGPVVAGLGTLLIHIILK